jgi:hypothetical protein
MAYFDNDNSAHKKYIHSVVDYWDEFICNIFCGNRCVAGCIFSVLHALMMIIVVYNILIENPKSDFYLTIVAMVIIIICNYHFHGCIFTRIERSLLNNKKWHGPTSIFNIFYDVDKDLMNWIIKYLGVIPICTLWLIRFFF